jgi:MFS family permease
MGAASLAAAQRFHTNAEQLASLAVLQIAVYAVMQVPVGFLLDRFGARRLLIFGALAMGSGQLAVAFSDNLSQAIVGRVLVGLGDAFTFISFIRVINGWYKGRRASQLQQWLANLGQLGQVLSAFPFATFLTLSGWQSAFLSVTAASILAAVLVFVAVQNERVPSTLLPSPLSMLNIREQFTTNLRSPGTRFAFWVHFSSQSASTVFALLWGFPFLQRAEGLSHSVSAALISSMVFIGMATGLFYGWVCGARPHLRYRLVMGVSAAIISAWSIVLLWPGVAPLWVLIGLVAIIGGAGPASMIAFDFSREYTPLQRLGSANGIVNIGGFLATLLTMYLVGVTLDLIHQVNTPRSDLYALGSFRIAMWIQVAMVLAGMIGLRREHKIMKLAGIHRE